jgi:hypothetical protein
MPNLLIVGDSNNGKTSIVRHLLELHGEGYVNAEAEAIRPIIVADAPPSADEKGLYISILECFWAPYRATDPTVKLRYQLFHQLRSCQTRIVIIDEFHSLLTGTPVKQREVMNAIKLMCNELMVPIVGVGTLEAVRVLHSDPQHASRFDVVPLPLWSLGVEFQKLIQSWERVLPLKYPSNLSQPDEALTIHTISGGNLGNVHRLLVECAKEAITSGKERIDISILKDKSWLQPTRGIREMTV